MKYLVRVGNLKHKIDIIEKQLVNIDDKVNELENIKLNLNWDGEAANTFNEVYDEYLFELRNMEDKLLSYVKFLMDYCNQYGEEYSSIRKRLRTILSREITYDNN